MQNEPLDGRYTDLVSPKDLYNHQTDQQPGDSTLARLVADLEHLYSSEAPSALLTERIEAVLQARADQIGGQDSATTLDQSQSHIWPHIQRTNTPSQTTMLRQQTRVQEGSIAMTRKRLSTFAAIAAAVLVVTLMGVLLYSIRAGGTSIGTGSDGSFLARLQRVGGMQVVLDNPPCPSPCPLVKHPLSADIPIIEQRLASKIATDDFQVFINGSGQLVVEVAGSPLSLHDLVTLVGETGELDIINTGSVALSVGTDVTGQVCSMNCSGTGGQYQVIFTGADLDPNSIKAELDPQTNQPIVTFEFAGAARSKFADYTERNIGNYLTITLDNKVIESATINSQITGAAEISGGNMTVADAQNLAMLLKTGALPVPLQVISYSQVKPGTPFPTSPCQQPTPTPTPAGPGPTPTVIPTNIATATPGPQSDGSGCQTPTVTPGNPAATPTATAHPPATYTPGAYKTPTPPPTPTPTPHP